MVLVALIVAVPVGLRLARSEESLKVETERVVTRELSPTIMAAGTLTYESQVTLVPEIVARVREVLVKEGDAVKKGQILLRLDAEEARAQLTRIEAVQSQSRLSIERQQVNHQTQEARWQRYQSLYQRGLIDANTYEGVRAEMRLSEVELSTSHAMLGQTEADLKLARERLAKTEIRSPIEGQVTAVFIKAGETAVPSVMGIAGSNLVTVADTAYLYAEVNVNETDVGRIRLKQDAKIVPAAFPDESLGGVVEQIGLTPRQNPGQSKTYPVKIKLANATRSLFRPGMSCRAEVSTRGPDSASRPAVPVEAVKYSEASESEDEPSASLFIVRSGRATRRAVETGLSDDKYIEIVKGLALGEEVITGPARILRLMRNGDRVIAGGT